MTTQEAAAIATTKLGKLSLSELIDSWEHVDAMNIRENPELADVRGWIMDELEARNAEAFDQWIDSIADSPREFYVAH